MKFEPQRPWSVITACFALGATYVVSTFENLLSWGQPVYESDFDSWTLLKMLGAVAFATMWLRILWKCSTYGLRQPVIALMFVDLLHNVWMQLSGAEWNYGLLSGCINILWIVGVVLLYYAPPLKPPKARPQTQQATE